MERIDVFVCVCVYVPFPNTECWRQNGGYLVVFTTFSVTGVRLILKEKLNRKVVKTKVKCRKSCLRSLPRRFNTPDIVSENDTP